jgi:hypothetical protein
MPTTFSYAITPHFPKPPLPPAGVFNPVLKILLAPIIYVAFLLCSGCAAPGSRDAPPPSMKNIFIIIIQHSCQTAFISQNKISPLYHWAVDGVWYKVQMKKKEKTQSWYFIELLDAKKNINSLSFGLLGFH